MPSGLDVNLCITREELRQHVLQDRRKVALDVDLRADLLQPCQSRQVPPTYAEAAVSKRRSPAIRTWRETDLRDEGDVGDGALAADEPFLLGEHALKYAEDTHDLLGVALDRAGHLLRVIHEEPACLSVIWAAMKMDMSVGIAYTGRWEDRDAPLSGCLEEKPLQLMVLLVGIRDRDTVLGVVLVDEVLHDSAGLPDDTVEQLERQRARKLWNLPDDEVVVGMVDERRDTPVRVVLCVLRALVLVFVGVEVYEFVFEAEFAQDEGDLPVPSIMRMGNRRGPACSTYQPLGPLGPIGGAEM